MEKRKPFMGRRFEILCLLDGTHASPRDDAEWFPKEIAAHLGISPWTVVHLLARMRKNDLVSPSLYEMSVEVLRRNRAGKKITVNLPIQPYIWSIKNKGFQRIAYMGGHDQWCAICKRKTKRRQSKRS